MTHINGCGGVIAIAKDGDFGIAFNTLEAVWAKKKNNHLESGMRISEFETYGGLK